MKTIPIQSIKPHFVSDDTLPIIENIENQSSNQYLNKIYQKMDVKTRNNISIESGYFILTMMPSLKCSLNCPHCYLTKEQRRSNDILSLLQLDIALNKIKAYYNKKEIKEKIILVYWYGGEPTEMGIDYFKDSIERINQTLHKEEGYIIKHTILTSLIGVDKSWFDFFKTYCDGHFQTSFDGLMRGKGYLKKWQEKVIEAKSEGLSIGAISVINYELLKLGAKETLTYLSSLGIEECSFLPFMLNEQNKDKSYGKYARGMQAWSQFMIEATEYYFHQKLNHQFIPEIGQLSFIVSQNSKKGLSNIAGQTLFLLPNGDFVLPDYKNGYEEYMRVFGNILKESFEDILSGKERMSFLKKQILRNHNIDCNQCDYAHQCVMEFWKENIPGDDCFGGKSYIEWLLNFQRDNNNNSDFKKIFNQLTQSILY